MGAVGFAVIFCLGVLILWFMYTYNTFAAIQKNIDLWWEEVDTHLKLRRELVPSLLAKARQILPGQEPTFQRIESICCEIAEISDDADKGESEELENELSAALRVLQDATRNDPDSMMKSDFLATMGELVSIEGRASAACAEHNRIVSDFNASIIRFPANLVLGALHFYPCEMRIFGSLDGLREPDEPDETE